MNWSHGLVAVIALFIGCIIGNLAPKINYYSSDPRYQVCRAYGVSDTTCEFLIDSIKDTEAKKARGEPFEPQNQEPGNLRRSLEQNDKNR